MPQEIIDGFNANDGAHLIFSDAINFATTPPPSPATFTAERVVYTDFNFRQTTTVQPIVDGKPQTRTFVMPGETILITHKGWNEQDTEYPFVVKDAINFNEMDIKSLRERLNVTEVKVGTDLNDLKDYDGQFDKDHPMTVEVPEHRKPYYIQYKVTIPKNAVDVGEKNQLRWSFWLGPKGATQYLLGGDIDILARPSLYTQTDEKKTVDTEFLLKKDIPTGTSVIDALWKDIYAKASDDLDPIELLKNSSDIYENFSVTTKYCKNGQAVSETDVETIDKNDVVSLTVTIQDKRTGASNSFTRYIVGYDQASEPATDETGNVYYFLSGTSLVDKTETQLAAYGRERYISKIIEEGNVKLIKVNSEGKLEELQDNIDADVDNFVNGTNVPKDEPYELTIKTKDIANITGNPVLKVTQKVTANVWDYDGVDKTTDDGEIGFIVIPKDVVLRDDDEDGLASGIATVKFSKYQEATNVAYYVSVDKMFPLTFQGEMEGDLTAQRPTLMVESSLPNGAKATIEDDKLSMGVLSLSKDSLTVNFKTTRKPSDEYQGQWTGNVNFYFARTTVDQST